MKIATLERRDRSDRVPVLLSQKKMLAVIDSRVEAFEMLAAGVRDGAEVIILDSNLDGVEQISQALKSHSANSLHVISHGEPGCLYLGNGRLNLEAINRYSSLLQQWGTALGERGEILIYGCNVASESETFLQRLHLLTGAAIAASTSRTGSAAKGGNWNLEFKIGAIASPLVFTPEAIATYPGAFAFGTPTSTGIPGNSIVTADFNGDGKLDLANADGSNNVSVLLGDGAGNFTAGTPVTVGVNPVSLTFGDFNGNGTQDIATANSGSDSLSILLNDGAGNLTAGATVTFAAGTAPISVIAADFNGDTRLDLAAAIQANNTVSILVGDGAGNFSPPTNVTVAAPGAFATGDFNGDAKLDLATANVSSNKVTVLVGDGAGNFTPILSTPTVGAQPTSLAAGDFNADGKLDIATANQDAANNISVLLGDGAGNFTAGPILNIGGAARSIVAADLNGDGKLDLAATGGTAPNDFALLLGDGAGNFAAPLNFSMGAGTSAQAIAVGDFTSDGKVDMATAGSAISLLKTVIQIAIAAGTNPSEAGLTSGTFNITLDSPAPAGGLAVNFNTTGSTAAATRYSFAAGANIAAVTANSFTIAAGATTATLTVVPVDDNSTNPGQTIKLNLAASGNYIFDAPAGTASLTVGDNEPFPTVTAINRVDPDPTSAATVNYTVTFSQDVTGVDAADFALATTGTSTGAAIASVTPVSGNTYTVAVTTGSTQGTIGLNLADNDSIRNAGGAPLGGIGTIGTPFNGSFTGQTYTVDAIAPTVTINQDPGQADPTAGSTVNFLAVFSKPVTGFDAADITLGGTAGATTPTVTPVGTDGKTYNVAVTGMTADGTVTATVNAGAAADTSGNPSAASTSTDNSVTYTTAFPTASTITRVDPEFTNATSVNYTVTFSGDVTGVNATDFTLATTGSVAGAAIASVTPVSASTYTVAVNTGTGDGTVQLNFVDDDTILNAASVPIGGAGAGNGNATGQIYTIDTTAPTVTINQSATQADPTGAATVNFTAVFSEAVTGFDATDIVLSGTAGATTAAVTPADATGTTYNVAVTGMTAAGTVIAAVNAGAVADAAGNASAASTSTDSEVTYQILAPEIQVLDATTEIADGSTAPVSFNSTLIGTPSVKTFALKNTGTATLNLSNLTLPPGFSLVGDFPPVVEAGAQANLQVQMDAAAAGAFSGTLSFATNDSDENPFDFAIAGNVTAQPEPEIQLFAGATEITDGSATPVNFTPTTVGSVVVQTFAVKNIGTAALNLSNLQLPEGFSLVGALPATVEAGAQANLQIVLNATAAGNPSGTVSFATNDTDESQFDFAIAGTVTGITPTPAPTPTPFPGGFPTPTPAPAPAPAPAPSPAPSGSPTPTPTPSATPTSPVESCIGDRFLTPNINAFAANFTAGDPPFTGTENIDLIFGNAASNSLNGAGGDDVIVGLDSTDNLDGGSGADLLYGNVGGDILNGGSENDTLFAGKDSDAVFGGSGDDLLSGDIGDDTLLGSDGNDLLYGNVGADFADGGGGNDTIFSGRDNDILKGDIGSDILSGDIGDDIVDGGGDGDSLYGNIGNDLMDGCQGDDKLFGGKNNDNLLGNAGNDQVFGELGDDLLFGNAGADLLDGGDGNDNLFGGKEGDVLIGGLGSDALSGDVGFDNLTGGGGSDRFLLKSGSNTDLITDFTDGEDFLSVAGFNFSQLAIAASSEGALIKIASTDELLATLAGVDANLISAADFI